MVSLQARWPQHLVERGTALTESTFDIADRRRRRRGPRAPRSPSRGTATGPRSSAGSTPGGTGAPSRFSTARSAFWKRSALWPTVAPRRGAPRDHADHRRYRAASSARRRCPFGPAEIGLDAFGWNIENADPRREARRGRARCRNLTLFDGHAQPASRARRRRALILRSTAATSFRAKPCVAADGRNSKLRQSAGIEARTLVLSAIGRHGDPGP